MLNVIKASNGRFLKKHEAEEGVWVEVNEKMAREKISHCFRTKVRKRWAAPLIMADPDSGGESKMSIDSDTDVSLGQSQNKRLRTSYPDGAVENTPRSFFFG